ncbi:AI-2E family transporter [Kitasatospora kifunensis]|uniref:Putative PurR-regulated permease PerM n=1 Tax=Kitasatospora kifunensis TaxID=58351 RepID=A0A7W7RAV2_KITKI|nr:AI-2E family transporter [Kitasatospora kifunensis]MBB4928593.1 putative PurR-regulated permease PerM [Kitasatospora kifunensis]
MPRGLVVAAGYAWRVLLLGLLGYAVFLVLQKVQFLAAALFVALILTSVLRPIANLLARRLPRGLAVLLAVVAATVVLAGLFALAAALAASNASQLEAEFRGGLNRIERWAQGPPLHLSPHTASELPSRLGKYLAAHQSALISTAVSNAGRVFEVATGAALALFCAIFFIHSGDRMWDWFVAQLPARVRSRAERTGAVAWWTFSGYTRGSVIVSASNALLVAIALLVLRVPLVLPLTLVEFFASFVPLIGSPVALAVAATVALATRGPLIALLVLVLIVVIGQLEGHVLHPLVMSRAVRIHPVAIALSVAGGALVAGVVGAVVAVPVVSVAWAVYAELRGRPPRPDRGG